MYIKCAYNIDAYFVSWGAFTTNIPCTFIVIVRVAVVVVVVVQNYKPSGREREDKDEGP